MTDRHTDSRTDRHEGQNSYVDIYFVSGVSMEKLGGTVKHSSPACKNLMTSPPKTQETFFNLERPVPNGEMIQ